MSVGLKNKGNFKRKKRARMYSRSEMRLARNRSLASWRELFADNPRMGPMPFRSVLRIMEEHAEVIRGDGSRRRCEELRRGLRMYRLYARDWGLAPEEFAVYLWLSCAPNEYPEIDWPEIQVERLAYVPPRLVFDLRAGRDEKKDDGGNNGIRVFVYGTKPDSLRKQRLVHNGAVNQAIKRRLRQAIRPQRILIGERALNVKLTDEAVLEMRRAYQNGENNLAKLGRQYGVSGATVRMIVDGITWRHLPLDPRVFSADCPAAFLDRTQVEQSI